MLHYFSTTLGVSKFVALIEPDNHASGGVGRNTGFIESGLDTSGPTPMLRYEYSADFTGVIACRIVLGDMRFPSMGARKDALPQFRDACQRDPSVVAAFVGGSIAVHTDDEVSDVDLYAVTLDRTTTSSSHDASPSCTRGHDHCSWPIRSTSKVWASICCISSWRTASTANWPSASALRTAEAAPETRRASQPCAHPSRPE
jgi:hypothetical protein